MQRVEQPAPEVLAFVLVDAIHRDQTTGKCYLLGTYSTIAAPVFPFVQERICVYTSLIGGRGRTVIKLLLVDEEEERAPLAELEAAVNFPSPLVVAELTFTYSKVEFPRPGAYRLQLFASGELLREYRLVMVAAIPARQEQHPS